MLTAIIKYTQSCSSLQFNKVVQQKLLDKTNVDVLLYGCEYHSLGNI